MPSPAAVWTLEGGNVNWPLKSPCKIKKVYVLFLPVYCTLYMAWTPNVS